MGLSAVIFKSFICTEHSFFPFIGTEVLKWIWTDELQAGHEHVCGVSDRWRVKNGDCDWVLKGQLNRETSVCENTGDFFTTHTLLCFAFDAQFISFFTQMS